MRRFSWFDVLIIILFLLSVYFILTRIFGESASDLTIIVSLFSFFGSLFVRTIYVIYNLNREVGEFKVNSMSSFNRIKNDMGSLKSSMDLIKTDLGKIKKKLKI